MVNFIKSAMIFLMKRGLTQFSILVGSGLLVAGVVIGSKIYSKPEPLKPVGCNCPVRQTIASDCYAPIIETNQEIQLVTPTSAPSGSTWRADFGTIRNGNIYDAPQNYFAPGIIILELVDPSGNVILTLKLYLKEGTLPTNSNSPIEQVVDADSLDIPVGTPEPSNAGQSAQPGDPPFVYSSSEPTEVENLPSTTVGELIGYVAPTVNSEDTIVLISGTQVKKGKKCAVLPWPSAISKNCNNEGGKTPIYGPVKRFLGPWTNERKDFTVSAAISGKIGVSAGITVTCDYQKKQDTLYQYKDVYKCENGKWVFDHTEKCSQTRYMYQFLDPAYTKYFLFPPDGNAPGPGQGYSPNPMQCLPI